MNVTVVIPLPLQGACEGRSRIELGLPAGSTVGDMVATIMTLYPGLRAFMASERRPLTRSFGVALSGQTLYLFASNVKAQVSPVVT